MNSEPSQPDAHEDTPSKRWTGRAIAVQLVGIALSLGLLGWACALMLAPSNRSNIERILDASSTLILGVTALSAASVAINGLIFWWTLRPLRTLDPFYLIGVNSIATFLSVLPFKLNLATRVLIHRRRDGMPFRDIIAWLVGMSGLVLVTVLPPFVAGVWRGRLDAWWWLVTLGGIAIGSVAAVACGRLASNDSHAVGRWLARLSMGCWRIVRYPGVVAGSVGLRLFDIAALAFRFLIAGAIIGHPMPVETAIVFGSAFFVLSAVTPSGAIGVREGGVIGLGSLAGHDLESLATVTLIVSAAELVISGCMAVASAAILRPDRLLRRRGSEPTA
jgi:uncharacterized membrane protein YbhN (UPF0104 family)